MQRAFATTHGFRAASRTLVRFGRPHRRGLALGAVGCLGVVACRLFLPWPLRWALEIARAPDGGPGWLGNLDPILEVTLVYLLVVITLGGFEFLQRLNLGRFTALLVRDLRADGVAAAASVGVRRVADLGDITARLIGDSARLKSDLTGILIHASTNGLLFLCVSVVMLVVSTSLGLVFLASGALVVLVGVRTSFAIAANAHRQRTKEGDYATELQRTLAWGGSLDDLTRLNDTSGSKEMRSTRILARSSLLVHTLLGAAICLGLWLSVREIRAGSMAPGEMFLFVAYALTVHRRMVQVGRQVARSGKVVASINRLASLLDEGKALASGPVAAPPLSELRLEGTWLGSRSRGRHRRLRRLDLAIAAGSRVAVLGAFGAGKSSLLGVLAGREPSFEGAVFWGDEPLAATPDRLAARVGYVGEAPAFPRRFVWELLGLSAPTGLSPEQVETLRCVGAFGVVRSFADPMQARVGSAELTLNEARSMALAQLLLTNHSPVWILDGPLEGFSRKKARRCLEEILLRAGGRTVLISMTHAVDLERFDRVLVLRRGRIVYDGPPTGRRTHGEAAA